MEALEPACVNVALSDAPEGVLSREALPTHGKEIGRQHLLLKSWRQGRASPAATASCVLIMLLLHLESQSGLRYQKKTADSGHCCTAFRNCQKDVSVLRLGHLHPAS